MAKQKNNIVMRTTRGMFGKQVVFKRRAGKGYVAAPPETDENRKPTPPQVEVQNLFTRATAFGKSVLRIPELKAAYKAVANRFQSAYNMAVKDAFNAPEVTTIFANGYRGVIGDSIIVQATDDFKVNTVLVSIFNAENELLEEGAAIAMADGKSWEYVATLDNPQLAGTKIKASAFDIPENEGSLEVTL